MREKIYFNKNIQKFYSNYRNISFNGQLVYISEKKINFMIITLSQGVFNAD